MRQSRRMLLNISGLLSPSLSPGDMVAQRKEEWQLLQKLTAFMHQPLERYRSRTLICHLHSPVGSIAGGHCSTTCQQYGASASQFQQSALLFHSQEAQCMHFFDLLDHLSPLFNISNTFNMSIISHTTSSSRLFHINLSIPILLCCLILDIIFYGTFATRHSIFSIAF